jgi:hypothetical protein
VSATEKKKKIFGKEKSKKKKKKKGKKEKNRFFCCWLWTLMDAARHLRQHQTQMDTERADHAHTRQPNAHRPTEKKKTIFFIAFLFRSEPRDRATATDRKRRQTRVDTEWVACAAYRVEWRLYKRLRGQQTRSGRANWW